MRTKTFILGAISLATLYLGTSSCSKSKNSLFGEIPAIYEEKMVDFVKKVKDLNLDDDQQDNKTKMESALMVFSGLQVAMQEAEEKAKPLAEAMVEKTVPYSESDSLPYQIVSDIRIEKVLLPELGLMKSSNKRTRLKVAFDAVFTENQENLIKMYYFIMSGNQAIGYNEIWKSETKNAGDTLHVTTTIEAPDIPSRYLETSDAIQFVTPYIYETKQKSIKEQQKEWNDAFDKELGINEE